MDISHRGRRTVFALLGALPMMFLAARWMTHRPLPGAEGGRGPLTARSLYAQAVQESERGDKPRTERHLRMALGVIEGPSATPDDRAMELRVRSSLGRVLLARGARDEALAVSARACRMGPDNAPPEDLIARGLCAR